MFMSCFCLPEFLQAFCPTAPLDAAAVADLTAAADLAAVVAVDLPVKWFAPTANHLDQH